MKFADIDEVMAKAAELKAITIAWCDMMDG
jgi:hypothetical protein